MRIISLELKNIRSYRQHTVAFPSGITLLSGDIGAGKSTLLHAIEFSLFGINRGELTGPALLRHGAVDGMTKLQFSIGGVEYTIMRALRRTAAGVVQDNGWIESGGSRQSLTPSELRAKIFELLGYPLQFLAKQRNLLYRFTIYTPQEEMKSILTQSSEERIETIRRIFGVDAYRIARDNAAQLAKSIREKESRAETLLARIGQESEKLKLRLEKSGELAQREALLLQESKKLAASLAQAQELVATHEQTKSALAQAQAMQSLEDRTRKTLEQEMQDLQRQHVTRQSHIATAEQSLVQMRSQIPEAIDEVLLDAQLKEAQLRMEQLRQEEGKIIAMIEHCDHSPNVAAGTTCPTCRQMVSGEHLIEVTTLLQAQGAAAKKRHERVQEKTNEQRASMLLLQQKIAASRARQELLQRIALQEKTLQGFREQQTLIAQNLAIKQAALLQLRPFDHSLAQQYAIAEKQLLEHKLRLQQITQHHLACQRQLAALEQEIKELAAVKLQQEQLLHEEEIGGASLAHMVQRRSWVVRQFSPFTAAVERHVLLSIHSAFDAVFRQWFSRLIDDDALATRINHEFAPVMLQNGYEVEVASLSGGERTAVSLAYRLALVHTIHKLSPELGTAGIILLDEPTDGFSSEQLERVRDVLKELRMEQIIIVSHEQQLEGFVDHIIRISKSADGSTLEQTA